MYNCAKCALGDFWVHSSPLCTNPVGCERPWECCVMETCPTSLSWMAPRNSTITSFHTVGELGGSNQCQGIPSHLICYWGAGNWEYGGISHHFSQENGCPCSGIQQTCCLDLHSLLGVQPHRWVQMARAAGVWGGRHTADLVSILWLPLTIWW